MNVTHRLLLMNLNCIFLEYKNDCNVNHSYDDLISILGDQQKHYALVPTYIYKSFRIRHLNYFMKTMIVKINLMIFNLNIYLFILFFRKLKLFYSTYKLIIVSTVLINSGSIIILTYASVVVV